jgi:hypothetical protein
MLLAAILLLAPIPQSGGTAKVISETPAVISSDSANDSSLSQPLPSVPDAKVKTDAEVAGGTDSAAEASAAVLAPVPVEPAVQPRYTAGSLAAVKPAGTGDYEATPNQRRLWYALVATGHGAAVFDAWSTRRAISQGYGTEGNPLLRPFSQSGVMYAATQVSPAVMDFVGKRMMVSRHPWVRRMWWLPQVAGSGASFSAGVHNVHLVP